MRLSDSQVDHLLQTWPVGRLALQSRKGEPRVLPVVFAEVSGTLWSPVDGKPKAAAEPARVRQLQEHPRVELLLDHYEDDWRLLWWVRISGIARVVQPPDAARDPDTGPVLEALRRKYPQYEETPLVTEPATLVAIRPDRIRSWCAGEEALRAVSAADPESQ